MIFFLKLTVKNFLSYQERQTVSLANQGVVLIEGINEDSSKADSNMAGKSSILEALVWCLFGKLLRGTHNADAVVNRRAAKNCRVGVDFSIDGKPYEVTRYRKDKTYQHRLRIISEGRQLSFRHEADTQRKLESILGCDFGAFVNSTVFGGFDGARKQFARLTDSEQKKVLDSFLRFEKFEIALKRTKRFLADSSQEAISTRLAVEKLSGRLLAAKERVNTLDSSARIFREKARDDKRQLQREFERLKVPKITVTKRQRLRAKKRVETAYEQIARLSYKRSAENDKLKKLEKPNIQLGDECPVCGTIFTKKIFKELELHAEADRKKTHYRLRVLGVRIEEVTRRLKYERGRLNRLTKRYNQDIHYKKNYWEKREELEAKLKAKTASTPFAVDIEKASIQYSRAVSRLLVDEYKLQSLTARMEDLEFWVEGFGNRGVKTLIVREALPSMNHKLKQYSQEILEPGTQIEFRPSKETASGETRELFYLHYQSRRNANNYLSESSGGRRRVDICILLVFCWMSRLSNILLVDELLDGLDDAGRQTVLGILGRQRGTVLVITHERDLKSKIEKVWTVRKRNGVSRIEDAA